MLVKLRLQRFGNKKKPFYRIVAATYTKKRDGRFLEILGLYHPIAAKDSQYRLDKDRILDWLNKGAQPTDSVKEILTKHKIWQDFAVDKEKRRVARVVKKRANKKSKVAKTASTPTAAE